MPEHLKEYQFQPGDPKTPGSGRKLGVRNKLSDRFLKDLHEEWERSGSDCLKILAKESPGDFAKLALGVIPREHEGLPPSVVVYTGVQRSDDATPTFQAPPAMLPAPKKPEPEAVECMLRPEDRVAPLPKAPEAKAPEPTAEVRKTEPLIYPKIVPHIGWR